MPSPIQSILRKATRSDSETLNILTFPTHERYEENLAKTGHNFYSWTEPGVTKQGWNSDYAKVPDNYILLNPQRGIKQLPDYIDIDLVLIQNRFGQFQIGSQIARQIPCPTVALEHTTTPEGEYAVEKGGVINYDASTTYKIQHRAKAADFNVFISEYNRKMWGWEEDEAEVIHHGVNTETFNCRVPAGDRKPIAFSVVNDWINRDWCCGYNFWVEAVQYPGGLPVRVVGDTEGLSESTKSTEELVSHFNDCAVFVNTSTASPIPTSVLEAMSCGCAVVSTDNCMIPSIVKHGYNGYCTNDPKEMREYILRLFENPELATSLGNNARKTVLKNFSVSAFVKKWNNLFYRVIGRTI